MIESAPPRRSLARRLPASALPPLAVLTASAAAWLSFGVGLREIGLFLGYELAFVLVPGCVVVRLFLPPGTGLLRWLALGWALGYVIEILAFMATAELGVRGLFLAYPPVAVLVGLAAERFAGRPRAIDSPDRLPASQLADWALAGVGLLVLAYIVAGDFAANPLPWNVPSVTYQPDLAFHISLAAEAKHHWPVGYPSASGLDYPYHMWAHYHMAAASQVTGLGLPLVFLRLFGVPLTFMALVQCAHAARSLTGRVWAAPVAAAAVFLFGELDLESRHPNPFLGFFAVHLWLSPSFLLGLGLFVSALVVLVELLSDPRGLGGSWRSWALYVLLVAGCAGAKASILPVLVGGLALFCVWDWLRSRRLPTRGLTALALTGAVASAFHVLLYRSAGTLGLDVNPPGLIRRMPRVTYLRELLPDAIPDGAFWILAVPVGLVGLYGAALVGIPWLVWERRDARLVRHVLLLALFAAGLPVLLLFEHLGFSQLFFSHYGFVAACLVSVEGVLLLARRAGPANPNIGRAVACFALAWVASLALIAVGLTQLAQLNALLAWPAGALVLAAISMLLWTSFRLAGAPSPLLRLAFPAMLGLFVLGWTIVRFDPDKVLYLFLGLAVLLLAAIALRSSGPRRAGWSLFLCTAVMLAGAVNLPLDHGPQIAWRLRHGHVLYLQGSQGLTSELFRGLAWVRDHTDEDAVLAVNNYYARYGVHKVPTYVYYSAFAERRVFLEGWYYAPVSHALGSEAVITGRALPFPDRLALNEAVFRRGDRRALRILARRYGVRYLLVDAVHRGAAAKVRGLGRLVFANRALSVLEVGADR